MDRMDGMDGMSEKRKDRSPELRVATFNIRNGIACDGLDSWPFRRRATADAVARLDADLVGLQEVYGFQQRYLLRRLPGYAATGAGRNDGRRRGERCTVLYRRARLALDGSTTRWFSDSPDQPGSTGWGNRLPRIVTLALFTDLASGRRFVFADCHLEGRPSAARHRSAAALAAWLDPALPAIVAGDLNAEPDDQAVRTLLAAGLRDVFAPGPPAPGLPDPGPSTPGRKPYQWADSKGESLPSLEGGSGARTRPETQALPQPPDATLETPPTTTGGFRGDGPRRRIDYLLVTRQWQVGEAAVAAQRRHRRLSSDHWPVVATLRLLD